MEITNEYDGLILGSLLKFTIPLNVLHIKAQALAESLLNSKVESKAGAIGLMQIMPETGAEMGYSVDDLYNPEKNIKAGVQYMDRMWSFWEKRITPFDLWEFSLASYNAGPGNMQKAYQLAVENREENNSFLVVGGLYLPRITGEHAHETLNYIARIKRFFQRLGG